MNYIDKVAVARSFGKAACSYDQHAQLQLHTGQHLLNYLPAEHYPCVLDLGCGSGALLAGISDFSDTVIALDLSLDMLNYAKGQRQIAGNLHWLNGDADALPLQQDVLDLCVANLSLQWCADLTTTLQEIKRCLAAQGLVLFSTLVAGSLAELSESWQGVNNSPHINAFLSYEQLLSALQQSGMTIIELDVRQQVQHYQSVSAVLHSLKGIGANHVHGKTNKTTTISEFRQFSANYLQQQDSLGRIPLTYNIAYCLLQKNPSNNIN